MVLLPPAWLAALMSAIKSETLAAMKVEGSARTIGFARRATAYKRADLIFRDLGQLADITRTAGPIQLIFAGKAHPRDQGGKDLILAIFRAAAQVRDQIPIIYLENYDIALSKLLTSGVDLWLNTPLRPLEASGTSGMKAAHNGVPSLSVLDGWWIEGHIEGVTGWSIGPLPGPSGQQGDVNAEDRPRSGLRSHARRNCVASAVAENMLLTLTIKPSCANRQTGATNTTASRKYHG
jgi:starch phosphorylase